MFLVMMIFNVFDDVCIILVLYNLLSEMARCVASLALYAATTVIGNFIKCVR